MIDLPDLQEQAGRVGATWAQDVDVVLGRLLTGVARLSGAPQAMPPEAAPQAAPQFTLVYVYAPSAVTWGSDAEGAVVRSRSAGQVRECWSCHKACTHCQSGTTSTGGRGQDGPVYGDLLELNRDDVFDWAVVVSSDLLLIPLVRFLQSRGRKVIHGCFPPMARDLTAECWASIDLGAAGGR